LGARLYMRFTCINARVCVLYHILAYVDNTQTLVALHTQYAFAIRILATSIEDSVQSIDWYCALVHQITYRNHTNTMYASSSRLISLKHAAFRLSQKLLEASARTYVIAAPTPLSRSCMRPANIPLSIGHTNSSMHRGSARPMHYISPTTLHSFPPQVPHASWRPRPQQPSSSSRRHPAGQ